MRYTPRALRLEIRELGRERGARRPGALLRVGAAPARCFSLSASTDRSASGRVKLLLDGVLRGSLPVGDSMSLRETASTTLS